MAFLWFFSIMIVMLLAAFTLKYLLREDCSHVYDLLEERSILDKNGELKYKYKVYECKKCKHIKKTSKY